MLKGEKTTFPFELRSRPYRSNANALAEPAPTSMSVVTTGRSSELQMPKVLIRDVPSRSRLEREPTSLERSILRQAELEPQPAPGSYTPW